MNLRLIPVVVDRNPVAVDRNREPPGVLMRLSPCGNRRNEIGNVAAVDRIWSEKLLNAC